MSLMVVDLGIEIALSIGDLVPAVACRDAKPLSVLRVLAESSTFVP
jgi:hypothetical protein